MPDKKISELSAASALTGTELVPVVQFGGTKKATVQQIADVAKAVFVPDNGVTAGTMGMAPPPSAAAVAGGYLLAANAQWVPPPDSNSVRRIFVYISFGEATSSQLDLRTRIVYSTVQIP